MSEKSHILIIDDEKNYLLVLQTLLEDEGYTVTAISDPETALAFLGESEVDVVVTDMKMPRVSGREVLQRVKKTWPYIPVLIMTAFGSIESAVEVMKYGAFDYITKPFSNDELLLSLHNAAELARTHRQYRLLQEAMEDRYGVHKIVGRSRAIRDVLAMVDRAAPSRSTVLITGESGTGKELVARAIHYSSPRKEKPFVSVNCMATIGQVGNLDHENVKIGKAGRTRHMGIRPTVRGSVMNPNDHPHGGGEGKSPIGRPGPVTPWGKPALGLKTRSKHNRSDKMIVKRRNSK